jgi:2-methylcitrate dehydratase PrpD
MRTYAEQFGDFTANLKFNDIPQSLVDTIKLHILDILGICLADSTLPYAQIVMNITRSDGGKPESTVISFGDKLPAKKAAFINGCLAHGYHFDDVHIEAIVHPAAVIVPTVFALSQKEGTDGKTIITAIMAGMELIIRLGLAAPGMVRRGIDPNPACGIFAAAAASGKVYNMNPDEIATAMGICGVMSSGSMEWEADGSWTSSIQAGWAAQGGILAAEMAKDGFSGPHTILEGKNGFYTAFAGQGNYDLDKLNKGLGRTWETANCAIKSYPACTGAQAYVDCALSLKKEYQIDSDQIESLECRVGKVMGIRLCEPPEIKVVPPNSDSAQTSIPYTISAAFVKGRVGITEVSEEMIKDPRVLKLSRKVKVMTDSAYDEGTALRGWVKVTMKDGKEYIKKTDAFRGSAWNPHTEEEVREKFLSNAGTVITDNKARVIAEMVKDLDQIVDISKLMELCKKNK